MHKIIIGIFAHPDDEAFGPSGTLLMERKNGAQIHLVTLTYGDAGTNPDNVPDLAAIREQEWREAGKHIGAASMTGLGYKDGQLNNLRMIEIQEKLLGIITTILKTAPQDSIVELMSMDTNGISGHIDHIVAGRSACYVFDKLKKTDPRISRLRLACIPRTQLPAPNTHWLYMDAGRDKNEIAEIVDARMYHDEIITIMRSHHSQRGDGESHIASQGDGIGLNYFLVIT